jgi:hypothetical protein
LICSKELILSFEVTSELKQATNRDIVLASSVTTKTAQAF